MKIIDTAYNAIKRRHPNIPQDALPIELPAAAAEAGLVRESKQRGPKSVRFAECPRCLAGKPTGVIRMSDGSEVFRDHNKVLYGGVRVPCAGAGQVAPEAKP